MLTKSRLLKTSKNVFKAVHINGNTASLIWFGTNSLGKNVPLFGSKYYPTNNLPSFIKRHLPESYNHEETSNAIGSCFYTRKGYVFPTFKTLVSSVYEN